MVATVAQLRLSNAAIIIGRSCSRATVFASKCCTKLGCCRSTEMDCSSESLVSVRRRE